MIHWIKQIDGIQLALDNNRKTTEDLLATISDQQRTIVELSKKVFTEDRDYNELRIANLERKIENMELERRRLNLIIHGVPEREWHTRSRVNSLFRGVARIFGGGGVPRGRGGGVPRSPKEANKPNKRATELKPRTCAHQGSMFRPY